ncbi:hypothetical protein FQR65_LT10680 [Abscondita terminalis]|nr:hypothetical protein FQR65_LT10680 [Abscondita terminalis]
MLRLQDYPASDASGLGDNFSFVNIMKEGKELEIFCFLCKKQNTKSTINRSYSDDNNSVKENLMELYGDAVEHYLSDDVPVCLNCSQILDNTVRLKRQLYEVIVDNAVNMEVHGKPGSKSFDFTNIWMRVNDSYLYPQVHNLDLLKVTSSTPTDERCVLLHQVVDIVLKHHF